MAAMAASFVPPIAELLAAEEKCRETHPVVVIGGRGSSSSGSSSGSGGGDSDFHSSSGSGKIGSLSAVVAVAAAPPNFGQCVCSWRSIT
uniref:GG11589 n=1 Tax=Drosophila erecta TaxID=7220 RepID=B3P5U3_DROER